MDLPINHKKYLLITPGSPSPIQTANENPLIE